MQIYFDKENLLSFLSQRKDKRFIYCEETLIRHCHVFMNFSKEELIQETEDNEIIKTWMKVCSDGFDTLPWTWNYSFPPRKIKTTTPNDFDKHQHSAVYLITDECLCNLKNLNQYLVSNLGEEVDVLSQLWFDDKQYIVNVFNKLNEWSALLPYQSPCSDIIVCDKFFLLESNLLEYNLYTLLPQLSLSSKCSKINIVIFTLNEYKGKSCDFEKVIGTIKQIIQKKTGAKPSVAIVTGSGNKIDEHDRTIFTNYKLYTSGDTFNYFDSQGRKITKGRYFHVFSLASKDNENTAKGFLDDMQKLYDSIKGAAPNNIYKENKSKSNYLQL